jgi:Leucine-rich repeat (LRR) protein
LSELHLLNTEIEDISALNELKNLNYINLQNNYIQDISGLVNHPSLKGVSLDGNPLKSNSIDGLKTMIERGIYGLERALESLI